MSLVNDMLRDLEKRGQGGQSPLSDDSVRSVSHSGSANRQQKRSWPLVIVLVALILGFVLLAWQLWQQRSQDSVPAQRQVASTALSVQPTVVEVVDTQPEPARVAERLVISQVHWLPTSTGGDLVMQFNARPDIQLLNQTRQSVVIALPKARLDNTLPLPSSEVISEFNLMSAKDQLLLDLKASRDARFSLIRDSEHQIRVQVLLAKPQLPSSTSVAKSIRQNRSEVVSEPVANTAMPIVETKSVKAVQTSSLVSSMTGRSVNTAVADSKTKKPQASQKPTPAKSKATKPQSNAKVVAQSKPAPKPVFQKTAQVLTDDQAVAKARKLLQKNKVSTAQALLQKQLEQAPASVESRALLAGIYLAAGDHGQSERLVDEGLVVLPLDSGLKKVKARVLLAKGDSAAAVNLMERAPPAIKLDGEYHEIRAAALQQQGRAEDAVNVYYQLLKYDSRQARLWVGLGYSLELATRVDESRKAYESSLQVPNLDDNLKRFVTQRLKQLAER